MEGDGKLSSAFAGSFRSQARVVGLKYFVEHIVGRNCLMECRSWQQDLPYCVDPG